MGHLSHGLNNAVILPLALEYLFWEDAFAGMLARFGPAIVIKRAPTEPLKNRVAALRRALTSTQDCARSDAACRDPAAFETLVGGKARVVARYDWSRWLRRGLLGLVLRDENRSDAAPVALRVPT